MPDKLTLYVCHIDEGGPKPHACRRAHEALRDAGHDYDKVVFDKGRPFGLFTTGRRPKLKQLSGQEKLPVLAFTDDTTISGGSKIADWARQNAPSGALAAAAHMGGSGAASRAPCLGASLASDRGGRAVDGQRLGLD